MFLYQRGFLKLISMYSPSIFVLHAIKCYKSILMIQWTTAQFAKAAYLEGILLYARYLCGCSQFWPQKMRSFDCLRHSDFPFLYWKWHFACKKQTLDFNVTLSLGRTKWLPKLRILFAYPHPSPHVPPGVRVPQFENHCFRLLICFLYSGLNRF